MILLALVDHGILLRKVDFYGVTEVAKGWFKSYLYNRKQLFSVGNVTSEL